MGTTWKFMTQEQKDKERARKRAWRAANPEKARAAVRAWRQDQRKSDMILAIMAMQG